MVPIGALDWMGGIVDLFEKMEIFTKNWNEFEVYLRGWASPFNFENSLQLRNFHWRLDRIRNFTMFHFMRIELAVDEYSRQDIFEHSRLVMDLYFVDQQIGFQIK